MQDPNENDSEIYWGGGDAVSGWVYVWTGSLFMDRHKGGGKFPVWAAKLTTIPIPKMAKD